MYKNTILCLFGILILGTLKAQDATYSQFYNNKLYLNPAYTGSVFGTRMSGSYREQWSYLPGELRNFNFSADFGIQKYGLGMGLVLNQDREGEQTLVTSQALLSLTKFLKIYGGERCFDEEVILSFGLQGGVVHQNLDQADLIFGDQLDEVLGFTGNPSAAQPSFDANESWVPTMNAGMGLWWDRGSDIYSLGFAVNNLFRRQVSFINRDTPIPLRYTTNFTASIPLQDRPRSLWTLVPIGLWEHQGGLNTFHVGALGMFTHDPSSNVSLVNQKRKIPSTYYHIYGGLSYRSEKAALLGGTVDALIFHVGLRQMKLDRDRMLGIQIGYSYDLTLSDLRFVTHGSHELNIIINFAKRSRYAICPSSLRCYYEKAVERSERFLLY